MFSGIIQGTGRIEKLTKRGRSARMNVDAKGVLRKISSGESISVNGVCLTVADFSGLRFSSDISEETLSRTTLGNLRAGDRVNLEQSVRFSDRIGGHLVSGHVDGTATIKKIERTGNAFLFRLTLPRNLLRYCIEKGSIAVDGISLTINELDRNGIWLAIIPHTIKITNLGDRKRGDLVNIENDLVGKYIERLMKRS